MLMKVLISYAHSDGKGYAERLESDLKEQGIGPWIDKNDIKLGDIWLKEIDDAIRSVDYVLGIITRDYLDSTGGVEAYAKISEGLNDRNIRFIPCFFISPEESRSSIVKAIQGADFSKEYKDGFRKVLGILKEKDAEDPLIALSKIESPHSDNPFRRVRTEFFQEDYKSLAAAFAEPEKEKLDLLRESRPLIIFGGRGSGKTMVLKSLTPEVQFLRLGVSNFQAAKEKGMNYFGIYFKLKKGSLSIYDRYVIVRMGFENVRQPQEDGTFKRMMEKAEEEEYENEPILVAGAAAARAISLDEFNLKILKTTLEEIKMLHKNEGLKISHEAEERIVKKLSKLLGFETLKEIVKFDEIIDKVDKDLRSIQLYIRNLTLPYAQPSVDWTSSGTEFLDDIFKIVTTEIEQLNDVRVYLLFDEFENLNKIQQTIVNEWIKISKNFTVKAASKFEGHYTTATEEGQCLQDGQDYLSLSMDYDLTDRSEKGKYQQLLKNICSNILEIEGYEERDIRNILEEPPKPELPQSVIDLEIRSIRNAAGQAIKEDNMDEYRRQMGLSAIFRILRRRERVEGRKMKTKIYAGFESYTYLSSGIPRIFLNLMGMAFYLSEASGKNTKKGDKISYQRQTEAAYKISRVWLENIPVNLEQLGDKMYAFICDLGDIFRIRLLFHSSEPETLVVRIIDPNNLPSKSLLNKLLSYGVRESIFYARRESSSQTGKQLSKPRRSEYMFNRIYAPILEISYRPRWARSCEFTTTQLAMLLDDEQREEMTKQLQSQQKSVSSWSEFDEGQTRLDS